MHRYLTRRVVCVLSRQSHTRRWMNAEARVRSRLPGFWIASLLRLVVIQVVLEGRAILWRLRTVMAIVKGSPHPLAPLRALRASTSTPALVLANGPSVNQFDAAYLRNLRESGSIFVYGVNLFPMTGFARTSGMDALVLSDPESLIPEALDEIVSAAVDIGVSFVFLPVGAAARCRKTYPNVAVIEFCDLESSSLLPGGIRPDKPRRYCSLTAYKALALACFLGHSKIYILGFDNSFIHQLRVNDKNEVGLVDRHFDETVYSGDGRFARGAGLLQLPMHYVLQEYARMFFDLHRFLKLTIINLDPWSLTDAFPKDDQALKTARINSEADLPDEQ
jgi:hypothetical protein